MEPGVLISNSKGLSNNPCPEPNQPNSSIVTNFHKKYDIGLLRLFLHRGLFPVDLKIKSVAYSSQGTYTGQLDFCNWHADGSTKCD